MPRNFKRRAEILYPIENTELKARIINEILMTYLRDNVESPRAAAGRLLPPGEAEGRGQTGAQPERAHRHRAERRDQITAL